MTLTEAANGIEGPVEAARWLCAASAAVLSALRASIAGLRRRERSGAERDLARALDRFELERREQAWLRGDAGDGSLLGR